MHKLYWVREDRQGDIDMGLYATKAEAELAIEDATKELINQCPGPHVESNDDFVRCRDEILAGTWFIDEVSD